MPSHPIDTPDAPGAVGAYSQGWRACDFVFVTGTTPMEIDGTIAETTVAGQTRRVVANLRAVLQAAGADLEDVVKSAVYLADTDDFAEFNAVYDECFAEPRPVRTTIGVGMGQGPRHEGRDRRDRLHRHMVSITVNRCTRQGTERT